MKKGNLTIQNGTMKKTGAVLDSENGVVSSTLIQTGIKGTVKIISGSYKGELSNNGKMTITGGTFPVQRPLFMMIHTARDMWLIIKEP